MHDPCDVNRLTPWTLGPYPPANGTRARIARVWHGVTDASAADDYLRYVRDTGVTEALRTTGNKGVVVLRRLDGDAAHFVFVSLWEGMDGIRAFAGPDIDVARYFPDDARWLRELTPHVEHYLVPVFATRH